MEDDNQGNVLNEVDDDNNDDGQEENKAPQLEDLERAIENNNEITRYTQVDDNYLNNQNADNIEQNEIPLKEKENENEKEKENEKENENENENKPEEIVIEKKEEEETNKQNKETIMKNPLYHKKITYNFKIIVVGDIAVGKTSVINRYITNTFQEEYKSSIGCEYQKKNLDIDAESEVNLQIWDTAGEEKYMAVTKQYYNDSHGALVVYDLTKKHTFEKMNKWLKDVKDNAPKDIAIMIVGNKSDLINEKVDLGSDLESYKNKYLYCEISAKSGTNVSLAFEKLTGKIISNQNEKSQSSNISRRDSVALRKASKKKVLSKCKC